MMLENLEKPISTGELYQFYETDTDNLLYGDNAPVLDYMETLLDVDAATGELIREGSGLFRDPCGYPDVNFSLPADAGAESGTMNWADVVFCLMNTENLADYMLDPGFTAGERWHYSEEEALLCGSINAAKRLTKKQMLELFPKLTGYYLRALEARTAFEVIDELLREMQEQNQKLKQAQGRGAT